MTDDLLTDCKFRLPKINPLYILDSIEICMYVCTYCRYYFPYYLLLFPSLVTTNKVDILIS